MFPLPFFPPKTHWKIFQKIKVNKAKLQNSVTREKKYKSKIQKNKIKA